LTVTKQENNLLLTAQKVADEFRRSHKGLLKMHWPVAGLNQVQLQVNRVRGGVEIFVRFHLVQNATEAISSFNCM